MWPIKQLSFPRLRISQSARNSQSDSKGFSMRYDRACLLLLALVPVRSVGVRNKHDPKSNAHDKANAAIVHAIAATKNEEDEAMRQCVASKGQKGVSVLNRIYHPDMIFISKHGALITRTQRIADLSSGNLKFLNFGRNDYSYYVYDDGNAVVQTGVATSDVIYKGKEDKTPRRFTNVFIKIDGQWRLVEHQATTIARP